MTGIDVQISCTPDRAISPSYIVEKFKTKFIITISVNLIHIPFEISRRSKIKKIIRSLKNSLRRNSLDQNSSVRHRLIACSRFGFSMAAETRSLSFSCLLIASSVS